MAVLNEHAFVRAGRTFTLLAGPAGWGECSPLPGYPSDEAACRRAAETAALDGFPPPVRTHVPVNALVDGPGFDPRDLLGYPAVKVKVGGPGDDDLVAAVRDAVGPSVALRVDANGRWTVDDAIARIGRLARYDLELVEQPVSDLEGLARVRRAVRVPVAADECVRSIEDARRLRALDAADAIVVKQQPLGGVRAAQAVIDAAGVPAIVSSMMETSVGIMAGVALAAALADLPFACGLATAPHLAADVTSTPLVPVDGRLEVRTVVPDLLPDLVAEVSSPTDQAPSQEDSSVENPRGSSR